eukprot:c21068_g1_i1 orf=464-1228(-)
MKRELQGNRPPPLRINKDSQKIRKPSLPIPVAQYRQPVVIHTYSPEVIQTDPRNFMQLVQRLTGHGSSNHPIRYQRAQISTSKDPLIVRSAPSHSFPEHLNNNGNPLKLPEKPSAICSGSMEIPGSHVQQNYLGLLGPSPCESLPSSLLSSVEFPHCLDSRLRNAVTQSVLFDNAPPVPSPGMLPSPSVGNFSNLLSPSLLPSPGPISLGFLSDLPSLSPATHKLVDALFSPLPSLNGNVRVPASGARFAAPLP